MFRMLGRYLCCLVGLWFVFFFKQKTAYEIGVRLVGSEMRIRDKIQDIVQIFDNYGLETEIIAASIRNPIHVTDCALAGAHIATVPYKVIEQMTKHPLTDAGIEKFQADYRAVFGD